MSFENLARHVEKLGGIKPVGDERVTFPEATQRALAKTLGAPLPPALKWFWATFGGGVELAEPIVYFDPKAKEDTLLGWFLSPGEIEEALSDAAGALAAHRLPIGNDGGDNLLVIDKDGAVWQHLHDAPSNRNSYRVAESFEQFLLSLKRGE